jgi:hypothetical protein
MTTELFNLLDTLGEDRKGISDRFILETVMGLGEHSYCIYSRIRIIKFEDWTGPRKVARNIGFLYH